MMHAATFVVVVQIVICGLPPPTAKASAWRAIAHRAGCPLTIVNGLDSPDSLGADDLGDF